MFQNRIILSLGSNIGNRKSYLQTAIQLLSNRVGTIVALSSIYETPAWGFEGNSFYNMVLVLHTFKNAEETLILIQQIEAEQGRVRNDQGYTNRTLDIDMVSFNTDVSTSHNLILPHPHIQNRKFVLQPLAEILPYWQHPVLLQSATTLLQNTTDTSTPQVVDVLNLPYPLPNHSLKFIAIEGNIGAGKTTLAQKIAEDFNAKIVLERFADNPFLPKFYADPARYAFPLEMSFLADRYKQMMDDLSQFDLFKDFLVSDYHIFKSLIFAKVTLSQDEFKLYKTIFDVMYKEVPKPDLYIYLYQNTDRLLNNIKKRGRGYEQNIPSDYLNQINAGYLDFIKTHPELNVKIIDITPLDFVANPADYHHLLNQLI